MKLISKPRLQPTNSSKMTREFQIAVEDSNVGAKRLHEKIGFIKQTQVVYLNEKDQKNAIRRILKMYLLLSGTN